MSFDALKAAKHVEWVVTAPVFEAPDRMTLRDLAEQFDDTKLAKYRAIRVSLDQLDRWRAEYRRWNQGTLVRSELKHIYGLPIVVR